MADARIHRVLPVAVRRHRPPAPLARALDRGHALARRSDRRAGRRRVRRGRDLRARPRRHARARRPSSSRTSRTRSATSFSSPPSSASSRSPAGGPARAGCSSGSASSRRRSRTSSTCSSRRKARTSRARGSTSSGPPRCSSSRRRHGCGDRTRAGLSVEGRPLLAVPAVVRRRRDRDPRLRPLRAPERSSRSSWRRRRSHSSSSGSRLTFRENRRLYRAHAPGGDHRRPDRAREPTPAHRRPRARARGRDRSADASHAVRPRRLQELQRHLRSPRRRRAARAARRRSSRPCRARDGAVYRLGGDEFCLIATVEDGEAEPLIDSACAALTERGEGFEIETSFGAIMLPDEATRRQPGAAGGRRAPVRAEVLAAGRERPHDGGAARGAVRTRARAAGADRRRRRRSPARSARMLGLRRDELEELDRAAQLHDLGKLAVPGRDPLQARSARRAGVGVRPAAHDRRRADPPRLTRAPQRRDRRARVARELGRQRLSGRHRRRGDPARLADHPRVQRLRRDDVASGRTGRRWQVDEALNELMRCAGTRLRPERSCASSSRACATSRKPNEPPSPRRGHTCSRAP